MQERGQQRDEERAGPEGDADRGMHERLMVVLRVHALTSSGEMGTSSTEVVGMSGNGLKPVMPCWTNVRL